MRMSWILILVVTSGCATMTVEPGHLGLMFDPRNGGLQRDVLKPGRYILAPNARVEDFDVTYSTRTEQILTTSSEGLQLQLRIAVIYRPVVSELYDLDSEIGLNYYDEVIGPEFRSASRGVFAHHSYLELLKNNESIENEVEESLRRRSAGKHVDIGSVTLEAIEYAPQIIKAVTEKLAAEQDAARQKTLLENEAARHKLELTAQAEQAALKAEAALREKRQEAEVSKAQAALDKIREESQASTRIIRAKAEAEEAKLLASAKAAQNHALTPLSVMQHGYDALKSLGGSGANIMIGDWSKVPSFLFPPMASLPRATAPDARTKEE
jgi:regulator of protease activity HflC (stomatin/prohibitin superfamily)